MFYKFFQSLHTIQLVEEARNDDRLCVIRFISKLRKLIKEQLMQLMTVVTLTVDEYEGAL